MEHVAADRFAEFKKQRNVSEEGMAIIEQLKSFPRSLVNQELHNFFTQYPENSAAELRKLAARAGNEQTKALFESFADFADTNDHYTCHHLERILEGDPI